MMKMLHDLSFNQKTYESELTDFNKFLSAKSSLKENSDILPFFRDRPCLASRIGMLAPNMFKIDKIAFEFDLFGDFVCDLVLGDAQRGSFCFVEFEDADENSLFTKKKGKYQPEFSFRFERGYSQIIDWFYKLNHVSSHDLMNRFDTHTIRYQGVLVIGRNHHLTDQTLKIVSIGVQIMLLLIQNKFLFGLSMNYARL